MITHLMHCAAVGSEFNAMELILLHEVRGLHHFMICAYLPARGCAVHMGRRVRFCVKLLCGNTVTMRQHGINLRASQFPHPTPRHNTQSTMLCPMLCYAMPHAMPHTTQCTNPCYAPNPCGPTAYPRVPCRTLSRYHSISYPQSCYTTTYHKTCWFSEGISIRAYQNEHDHKHEDVST